MAFVVIWKVLALVAVGAAALIVPFLVDRPDLPRANLLKVLDGGWVPLAFGGVVMVVM